jgi:hypothetical protein
LVQVEKDNLLLLQHSLFSTTTVHFEGGIIIWILVFLELVDSTTTDVEIPSFIISGVRDLTEESRDTTHIGGLFWGLKPFFPITIINKNKLDY